MYVETRDWRPGSMLDRRALTVLALLAGCVTSALGGALIALVILADLGGAMRDALGLPEEAPEERHTVEPEVIEAGFVQLGREFRPRELPDRQVPTSSTAPSQPDMSRVSKRTRPVEQRPEQPPPPPNAYEDALTRLGNTSRLTNSRFAAETEGDPDGNEEGRRSRDGDQYLGSLMNIIKRGWTIPVTIPDSELVGLRAVVSFRITDDLRMEDLRLSTRSGNADYDRSLEQRIEEIRSSAFRVPAPPDGQREQWIGRPISFNMLPPPNVLRDARDRLNRSGQAGRTSAPAGGRSQSSDGEPSGGTAPSGGREPSGGAEPSGGREPSGGAQPSGDGETSSRAGRTRGGRAAGSAPAGDAVDGLATMRLPRPAADDDAPRPAPAPRAPASDDE